MRYCATEKLEIIRLVEQSHLPVRRTLEQLGIPRPTFYRWYEHYRAGGPEALQFLLNAAALSYVPLHACQPGAAEPVQRRG